ncbi:MAG: cellulase family glycosylhydrolase [Anaerolineae bacterium]|jgi:cysteinyl-tRNA synthetase
MCRCVKRLVVGFGLVSFAVLAGACALVLSDSADGPVVATRAPTSAAATMSPPVARRVTPDDTAGWTLWSTGTRLRGANIYQRRVYPELDGDEFLGAGPVGPPYTQQDFDRLATMGANYVNVSHPGLFTETVPYTVDLDIQSHLDNLLSMIAQADMFAVISFRTGPGRAEFSVCCYEDAGDWYDESYLNDTVWQDQAAQDAWVEMWRHTAERYRDNPIVVGYDLMVEPNANEVLTGEWLAPEEFYAQYGGTLADWNQLYPRISAAIREVDADTPILIGGMGYSGVEWLPYLQPTGDPRTVYAVHHYAPHLYTHQWWDSLDCAYPGWCDLDWDGDYDDWLDRAWLDDLLSTVDDFETTHGVPVAVNEFGVMRWEPGAAAYMDDQMDLFEQRGMNQALWVWDPAWEPWTEEVDAFNFRHGPDPQNHSDVSSSELMDTILSYWGRNTIRPSLAVTETSYLPIVLTAALAEAGSLPLKDVAFWAYQLQGVSEPGAVDALVGSSYDMLVLEPTRTDWSSDDRYFDTQGMVAQLKDSLASDGQHHKLVLAYLDIGEAEDWRWYWTWSRDWNCAGDPPADWPDYILACDPDGWSGNYPVAYWDPAWKDLIIYGKNTGSHPDRDYRSAIDEAILDGFDGIYLDWVEGYENEDVAAAAQAAGKDPAVEMIAFIGEMRAYAQARQPGFLIIQQNAAALLEGHPGLLDVVDAIAQEAVWYDGDATDDWDDPDGYDWLNDPDLTDYYLGYLADYLDAGLPVFNCEYALAYAATAYANSYAQGFVPYTTRRSLSRLTTTTPPGY